MCNILYDYHIQMLHLFREQKKHYSYFDYWNGISFAFHVIIRSVLLLMSRPQTTQ